MQRHDRRVPVSTADNTLMTVLIFQTSFFSRYTRDIVSFANHHTEGKVVSVLEGGYSDRALTSAAMGHVIGMLGKKGQDAWWQEQELINVSSSSLASMIQLTASDRESKQEETDWTHCAAPIRVLTDPTSRTHACATRALRNGRRNSR
jgi:hypothetical protein